MCILCHRGHCGYKNRIKCYMFCHCFFIFLQDSNTNKGLTDETGYLHEHTKLLLFSQTLQMFRKGHILTNYQMTLSQYSFFSCVIMHHRHYVKDSMAYNERHTYSTHQAQLQHTSSTVTAHIKHTSSTHQAQIDYTSRTSRASKEYPKCSQ